MSWTLKFGSDQRTLDEWRIRNPVLRFISQQADTFSFEIPKRSTLDDNAFAYHDVVELFDSSGARRFYGRIKQTPKFRSGSSFSHSYVAAGPWDWLDNRVLSLLWPSLGINLSLYLVNLKDNGVTPENVRDSLGRVIDMAIALGIPMQKGTILDPSDDCQPPVTEQRDKTFGELIRDQLRWRPRSVCRWEYDVSGHPKLHIQNITSLPEINIPVTSLEQFSVDRAYDQEIDGVALIYRVFSTVNEKTVMQIVQDVYPVGSNPYSEGMLLQTIDLLGMQGSRSETRILSQAIAADTQAWWADRVLELDEVLAHPGLDVEGPLNVRWEDGADTSLTLELVKGEVPSWLNKTAEKQKIISDWIIMTPDGSLNYETYETEVMATDAATGTYTTQDVSSFGDPIPSGLARQMHNELSVPTYSGELTLLERTVGAPQLGSVVNITGGRTEWASMRGLVQQVTQYLQAGRTTISIGPAGHLAPQDYIELLR